MLSTVQLLDLAKERQGGVSDYRLAKLLGVPPSTVCNYRAGRSRPENPIAMGLAALCGLDSLQVVSWINIDRASSDLDRSMWIRIRELAMKEEEELLAQCPKIPLPKSDNSAWR